MEAAHNIPFPVHLKDHCIARQPGEDYQWVDVQLQRRAVRRYTDPFDVLVAVICIASIKLVTHKRQGKGLKEVQSESA